MKNIVLTRFDFLGNYDFAKNSDDKLNSAVLEYVEREYPKSEIFANKGNVIITDEGCFAAFYENELDKE
jgi:hypothetical protein